MTRKRKSWNPAPCIDCGARHPDGICPVRAASLGFRLGSEAASRPHGPDPRPAGGAAGGAPGYGSISKGTKRPHGGYQELSPEAGNTPPPAQRAKPLKEMTAEERYREAEFVANTAEETERRAARLRARERELLRVAHDEAMYFHGLPRERLPPSFTASARPDPVAKNRAPVNMEGRILARMDDGFAVLQAQLAAVIRRLDKKRSSDLEEGEIKEE